MDEKFTAILQALAKCPLVPVLTIDDVKFAAPLAKALSAAGLTCAEITLRTDQALDVIHIMKTTCPELMIGAGTVLTPHDVERVLQAGCDFLVTPGLNSKLLQAIKTSPQAVFPGVATPSEALEMHSHGFAHLKFFPAEANGGAAALKAMSAPLPQIHFMPTGGVNTANAPDYLVLPNVFAIGGSWMIDQQALANGDFSHLETQAAHAILKL